MEVGEWRVEGGRWRLESGGWRVEGGEWRVEGGRWREESGGDGCDPAELTSVSRATVSGLTAGTQSVSSGERGESQVIQLVTSIRYLGRWKHFEL